MKIGYFSCLGLGLTIAFSVAQAAEVCTSGERKIVAVSEFTLENYAAVETPYFLSFFNGKNECVFENARAEDPSRMILKATPFCSKTLLLTNGQINMELFEVSRSGERSVEPTLFVKCTGLQTSRDELIKFGGMDGVLSPFFRELPTN